MFTFGTWIHDGKHDMFIQKCDGKFSDQILPGDVNFVIRYIHL